MGAGSQILLVILLVASLLSPAAGAQTPAAVGERQAFWLWSGVRPTEALQNAQLMYLHQGDILLHDGLPVFERKGLPVSKLSFPRLWLTVRFTTLDVSDEMLERLGRLLLRWQAAGNTVVGLQIDFDAGTHNLDDYGAFLRRARAALPPAFALGVTGLLDWAKTGSVATLNTLPVDELVVQSYQGRRTVQHYADYLPALSRLRIPFKVGIVQNGEWDIQEEIRLSASPWYRGIVVFLLNP
ncbi:MULTISPECIES: DUF3142 domain-containing protein [unclassified Enterobacter]|uniref:DUF3142 domain-containing protein n=1 Tax=unclassified Enterobacter TaxID=2608935 RepID=UPI000F4AC08C|nr:MULTISPECIES: DUF3142 domain-containing protein [unclassified Enterobacter]